MALLTNPLAKGLAGILKGVGLVHTPSTKAISAPLPTATRDDAADLIANEDELRRRRGSAADIITGATGAEAPLTGGKLILG